MTTLSEAQYEELCSTCDQLLLAPDATLERIAIPWLHVLNEHPSNLIKYAGLFTAAPSGPLVQLRSAASQIQAWIKRRIRIGASQKLPPRADVLFISHLLNESQIGASDFYFGPLPELLMKHGVSSCVALIDHTRAANAASEGWSTEMAPRVLLPDALGARDELGLRRRLQREARRIRLELIRHENPRSRRIAEEAARQAVSSSSIASLRIGEDILRLARSLRPKVIVVTYEGHAWERLAFAAARRIVPGIRCIGYHHTVLFRRHHAALRPLGGMVYDPDVVLTAGDISRDRFRRSLNEGRTLVETMGIHRRNARPIALGTAPHPGGRTSCIVIPDGIVSEVVFLFDFTLEAAHQAPDINFILRLHPVVSLEKLRARFPRLRQLPANVELSTGTLDEDFSRSRWALYRGSNAAIYAVIAGVRPVYVEKPGEMTIDSMHELRSWKKVVRKPDQFVELARTDLRENPREGSADEQAAADYCNKYFMPPDYRAFAATVADRVPLDRL